MLIFTDDKKCLTATKSIKMKIRITFYTFLEFSYFCKNINYKTLSSGTYEI